MKGLDISNINPKDPLVINIFVQAAEHNFMNVFKFLVDIGVDINDEIEIDQTLFRTISNGRLEIIKYILEKSKMRLVSFDLLIGSLSMSIRNGHIDTVNYIFKLAEEEGIGINYTNLLPTAVGYNRLDILKLLHQKGANINYMFDVCIRTAVEKGYLDIIKFLVHNGANIHYGQDVAIVKSITGNGSLDVVQYLAENDVDIYAYDSWAFKHGSGEVVQYMYSLKYPGFYSLDI